ncbi:EAL and HDOD domain-containing protein [Thiobacter aerophilum]|uniref:EAL domain-containing protein n=1 Tax=Thiobacter aerophilum TaxID=3121275 RepID=A0ABV0EB38_9BURK
MNPFAPAAISHRSEEVFVGRQAIVDGQQRIIGYELLFRDQAHATQAEITNDLLAGTRVLVNTLNNMGTEWLFGDRIAFLNVSNPMLESEFLELLPARRVVLEILEDVAPTPELLPRLNDLRAQGFALALDDYDGNPDLDFLLPLVSYVKIDVLATPAERLPDLVASVRRHPVKLVAERVETRSMFHTCRNLKFDLFQGFYFARPETLTARVINPGQALVLELLNKVRANADIGEIEKGFKRDVALSFKLLRYINSVGFGLSCEIQSIRHALAILGYQQLYRWLTLLVVTANEGSTPPALMKTAVTRGRLTELLGQELLDKHERDNLFIVGIFSLLDAMLEMPMEQILERLNLPEPIADALLHREGVYGPFLQLAEACEGADIPRIRALAEALTLDPERVNVAHLQALAWVEELGV